MRWLLFILFFPFLGFAQQTATLFGIAQAAPGTIVRIEAFEDLFTYTTKTLASTSLKLDSSFHLSVEVDEIQKLKIWVGDNYSFAFVGPGANYKLAITNEKIHNFNNPKGNEVELAFLDLESNDINYQILTFDRWIDGFLGENYHLRTSRDSIFLKNLIRFEEAVQKRYEADTLTYLKNYIKYRVAALENLNFVGARNESVRYGVNIAPFTVLYKNEEYMVYVRKFYENFFERTTKEMNEKIYQALVAGSPSKLINVISGDYRVANVRVRELVMIIGLSDVYHNKEYPQSRIEKVLDSIAKNALFKDNAVIAKNTLKKLKILKPGSKLPIYEFLKENKEVITNGHFRPKYTYIQFLNIEQSQSLIQLDMLRNLYERYSTNIEFISVVMNTNDWSVIQNKLDLAAIPWAVCVPKDLEKIKETFQLSNYPEYVLIDAQGYLVAAPAASPVPDGNYKTIDYYFYQIHKRMSQGK